jgi:hypothetical protein
LSEIVSEQLRNGSAAIQVKYSVSHGDAHAEYPLASLYKTGIIHPHQGSTVSASMKYHLWWQIGLEGKACKQALSKV